MIKRLFKRIAVYTGTHTSTHTHTHTHICRHVIHLFYINVYSCITMNIYIYKSGHRGQHPSMKETRRSVLTLILYLHILYR